MGISVSDLILDRGSKRVLDGLSAHFAEGRVYAVVGPNGSGKSSLLKAIYGYLDPHSGSIEIDERPIQKWRPEELAGYLGVCPQEAEPSLDFQVDQMLSLRFGGDRDELNKRLPSLTFLGLHDLLERSLSELSGGERQRVRLGLALLSQAPWLILDEPANHLDLATAWSLMSYLTQPREGGVILALHDLDTAARYCHELIVLDRGKTVAQGPPGEVLTRSLLSEVFRLDANLVWPAERAYPDLEISGVCSNK